MKTKLFLLLFISIYFVHANDFKFGKVSKEEISETQHPLEPDANAAILYKKERVVYNYDYERGWSIIKEAHYRIKIYSKEGLDWATLQVPLYISGSDEEKISSVKGFTFNIVDEKIVSEKLKKDGVFVEKINKYRNKASITMPEVKEGSVLDIQFRVNSPLYWHMDDFRFQYAIPVNNVHLNLNIPQYFVFKRHSKGFYPIKLNESRGSRSISVSYRSEDDPSGRSIKTSRKNGTLDFYENMYEVNASNLPSLKEEIYTNNIDNYRAAIKFELASTQFPNRPYKNYSLSWEGVAKSIYESDNFGPELKKTNYFEEEVDKIIMGKTDDAEKAMLIFEFVKSKMTWDKYVGVTCSQGIKKAYKEGTGNVAEINLMLTAMFRYAGLKANPVLVSTRSHGIPLFPTTDGFNYVISGVEVMDNVILFDATEENTSPGILPNRVLNWMGRLVRKDGSSAQVDLIPKEPSKELHYMNARINTDGSVEGRRRTQYSNQLALSFRDVLDNTDEETYLEELENSYGEMEISSFNIKNKDEFSKPVVETCEFSKENQCEFLGDKIYFRPMLFLAQTNNPFKMDKREYPIDFTFPRQKKYMINLSIPEGYQIESLPENAIVQLPNQAGTFKFKIVSQENQIRVSVSTEFTTALFPSDYYDALKEYYKNMVLKQSEKVVLSKI
ncbi:transglutaminase [Flagellimonas aquimarina]|uniref:Transglutaminase n=1 Tax=Flagellimonas aquimarina TaxID=2201895 RepID=A0A316LCR3_9FLAO|nr:transglutaminase domain-containing protein [Allomuricauda koreensis]PWL37850.1 transglutaminase [Allomuricauda koreensis]